MTESDIRRIDLALEATNGNRRAAAEILEKPLKWLQASMRNNTALRNKWTSSAHSAPVPTEAPTTMDTMTIDIPAPTIPPVSPEHQTLVGIIDAEEHSLQLGLQEMGLSEQDIAQIQGLERFHRQHSGKLVDIFGASLLKRGLRLSQITEDLEAQIKDKDYRDIFSPDGAVLVRSGEESKFDLLLRCYAELRKMVELTHTASLMREKMRLWAKAGSTNLNGNKNRKPGFAPLKRQTLVNVQPGGTVNLNENGSHQPTPKLPPPPEN